MSKPAKIIISKHFITTAKKVQNNLTLAYYVEAKTNKHWRRIGGPFLDEPSANTFASEYSKQNKGVEVQVVLFQ